MLGQVKQQNNYDIFKILHTFSYEMIYNLSSICYGQQELLTAESSADILIWYRCRYCRQFEKISGFRPFLVGYFLSGRSLDCQLISLFGICKKSYGTGPTVASFFFVFYVRERNNTIMILSISSHSFGFVQLQK